MRGDERGELEKGDDVLYLVGRAPGSCGGRGSVAMPKAKKVADQNVTRATAVISGLYLFNPHRLRGGAWSSASRTFTLCRR